MDHSFIQPSLSKSNHTPDTVLLPEIQRARNSPSPQEPTGRWDRMAGIQAICTPFPRSWDRRYRRSWGNLRGPNMDGAEGSHCFCIFYFPSQTLEGCSHRHQAKAAALQVLSTQVSRYYRTTHSQHR
uniref:Uncharacterized protein n=1 Tax=Molossus molossus TaxID=27622 RepID=A0A7J8ERX1_MOLMO|nr:hypothetical protein HJG59_008745 [Molossus molossus]